MKRPDVLSELPLIFPYGSSRHKLDKVLRPGPILYLNLSKSLGGSNPAIRTLYYRLLRLLSASVQPLFVFDGPRKPAFKRNRRSGHNAGSLSNVLTKQLLKLFGFPFHIAPGEAEAECALLQLEGIVDAVLSEDVDTLMFGCGLTLRNWSSEGSRGNHSPTHVSMYDAQATKAGKSGLDREGMILIAMMSGGDYITEGIPGCGIKLACQAARAGFGKSLCRLSRSDTAGLDAWRKNLAHEIQTNESRYFKTRHMALTIPESFPNKEVLGYYTHPIVSSASKINKLKEDIIWDGEIDIPGLRLFVAETFEWVNRSGANKFIRGLGPALLVHKLRLRGDRSDSGYDDLILTAMSEMELVRAICGQRIHPSTDRTPELRLIYHPNDIVGLDLDAEEDGTEDYGRDGLAPTNEVDDIEAYASDPAPETLRLASPRKISTAAYNPTQPEKLWVLQAIAKVGIPLKVEDYEASLRNPKKFLAAQAAAKRAAKKSGMKLRAMDKFVKVSKTGEANISQGMLRSADKPLDSSHKTPLPPPEVATSQESANSLQQAPIATSSTSVRSLHPTRSSRQIRTDSLGAESKITGVKTRRKALIEKPNQNLNPWTSAQLPPTSCSNLARTNALGQRDKPSSLVAMRQGDCIDLSSSPNASPSGLMISPSKTPQKHTHSTQRENVTWLVTPPKEDTLDKRYPRKKRSVESPFKSASPHLPRGRAHPLTPEPVNRKIDFQVSIPRAQSSSPALPALKDLFPPAASLSEEVPLEVQDAGDINKQATTPERDRSRKEQEITIITSSPSMPSPVGAMSLLCHVGSSQEEDGPQPPAKPLTGKKYLMLRESLPGAWKEVDESMVKGARSLAWRQSQVEVLDMTED